jgi:hypothetical protein
MSSFAFVITDGKISLEVFGESAGHDFVKKTSFNFRCFLASDLVMGMNQLKVVE